MRRRNDGAGASPQEEFGDVCFHALGIIDQNREYLQMHLLASADLPTRQALSDIQIESARLDRTVRNAITLYQLENEELSELQPLDLCGLLEKAGRLAPDIQRSLEITLTTALANHAGIDKCLQIPRSPAGGDMDKAGIFCTSNTDISFQKVHHAFFTGNHVAHCFRFIREKAFIRTFQLHLTCHITFEFDAGTEFHRGHLDRLRTYFFLIHHRMGTLQRGAEEAKSLQLHK